MSNSPYFDNHLFFSIVISMYTLWMSFFTLNKVRQSSLSFNKNSINVKVSSPNGLSNEVSFLKLGLLISFFILFNNYTLRQVSGTFFFNQLYINSNNFLLVSLTSLTYLLIIYVLISVRYTNVPMNLDYLFSILNFFVLGPVLYMSYTLYSFFFLLEVLSVLTFIKFTSMQINKSGRSIRKVSESNTVKSVSPNIEKLVITLFYQYWISFFSSVFIILFIILSLFFFNTSSFLELELILEYNLSVNNAIFSDILLASWDLLFLIAFFLKSGIAPFHNYKVEIYRGLPIFSTFLYTFIFFLNFYTPFLFILYNHLPHILAYNFTIVELFVILASLYLILSLFNSKYFKTFLALSSVINSIIIFNIILATV